MSEERELTREELEEFAALGISLAALSQRAEESDIPPEELEELDDCFGNVRSAVANLAMVTETHADTPWYVAALVRARTRLIEALRKRETLH